MDYKETYFSPGKLLITGEYLVIDGAKALSLPTKKGQWLKVNPASNDLIAWKSIDSEGNPWFEGEFKCLNFEIVSATDNEVAERLQTILLAASKLDSTNELYNSWEIVTELDFPGNWGLGSSSTLLCNIAKWLKIDAYQLHFSVSNGSGYDIASGMENTALLYTVHKEIPTIKKINFDPIFKNHIYFVHLNEKQKSDIEVAKYADLKEEIDLRSFVEGIDTITLELIASPDLETFETLLSEHEQMLSYVLQRETSQEEFFQLYKGGITKYLGAWGGDFVLVTAQCVNDLEYFKSKGYHTILSYDEMILNSIDIDEL